MTSPEEEGRKAFMDKLPEDACPYEGKAANEWKLGYAKQELDELKQEQSNLLSSMSWYSDPYTGLEEFIQRTKLQIQKHQNALSR